MNINGDLVVIGKIRQGKLDSGNVAVGQFSHVEGSGSTAQGDFTFVHGVDSVALGNNTVVFGDNITGSSDNTMYISKLNIATQPVSATSNYDVLVRDNTTGEIKIGTGGGSSTTGRGLETMTFRSSGFSGPYEYISSIPGVTHPDYDLGFYIDSGFAITQLNFVALNCNLNTSGHVIPIEIRIHNSNDTAFGPTVTSGTLVHTENINLGAAGTYWNLTSVIPMNLDLSAYAGKHVTLNTGNYVIGLNVVSTVLVKLYSDII